MPLSERDYMRRDYEGAYIPPDPDDHRRRDRRIAWFLLGWVTCAVLAILGPDAIAVWAWVTAVILLFCLFAWALLVLVEWLLRP
jgi:hypothetical protein